MALCFYLNSANEFSLHMFHLCNYYNTTVLEWQFIAQVAAVSES